MLKILFIFIFVSQLAWSDDNTVKSISSKINQYYSGKFGFYAPSRELNNGLIYGIDGITEFNKLKFFLSGSIDLYIKKTIDIFSEPKPKITDQAFLVLPVHANVAYKLFEIPDAETKAYFGIGGGYYFYFYSVQYRESSGILGTVFEKTSNQNGGDVFFTVAGRVLIGKIFLEPRFYFAKPTNGKIDNYNYKIDPSGFAITLGFQY